MAENLSAIAIAPGTKLDKFTFVRRIALGGMAEIWLAQEAKGDGRDDTVALKVLLAPFAKDPSFRSMFQDEVQIASRLTHENIVQVHGAFELDGHLVQSMELVDGKDLRRILSTLARAGMRVPVPLALVIIREVARALSFAHTKRGDDGKPLEIVHRDISPHNVMITHDGCVKLLDFGIAKAAERLTRTRTGVIKGKIAYMAPEQALALDVTPKTDLFAMGIVLWEMLAMQRLFKADTDAMVLDRVIRADVPPIKSYNGEVPEELASLLHQVLAQRAQMRPDSARIVENALTRIILRHYPEHESSREALARWASELIEEDKGTGRFDAPQDEPAATSMSESGDREVHDTPLEMHEPYGVREMTKSGRLNGKSDEVEAHGEGDSTLPDSPIPDAVKESLPVDKTIATVIREDAKTIAMPIDPVASDKSNTPPTPVDRTTDPVRLPTRSEIQRAVDAQTTMPIAIDEPRADAPRPRVKVPDVEMSDPSLSGVARPSPSNVPLVMRAQVAPAASGASEPTPDVGLAGPEIEAPRPATRPLSLESDDDFQPVPLAPDVLSSSAKLRSVDPMMDPLDVETFPAGTKSHPGEPASVSPVSSDPEDALSQMRGVLIIGSFMAVAALGLILAVLLRRC